MPNVFPELALAVSALKAMKIIPFNRKGVDWTSPETIITIILILLLAVLFFYIFIRGKIGGVLKV